MKDLELNLEKIDVITNIYNSKPEGERFEFLYEVCKLAIRCDRFGLLKDVIKVKGRNYILLAERLVQEALKANDIALLNQLMQIEHSRKFIDIVLTELVKKCDLSAIETILASVKDIKYKNGVIFRAFQVANVPIIERFEIAKRLVELYQDLNVINKDQLLYSNPKKPRPKELQNPPTETELKSMEKYYKDNTDKRQLLNSYIDNFLSVIDQFEDKQLILEKMLSFVEHFKNDFLTNIYQKHNKRIFDNLIKQGCINLLNKNIAHFIEVVEENEKENVVKAYFDFIIGKIGQLDSNLQQFILGITKKLIIENGPLFNDTIQQKIFDQAIKIAESHPIGKGLAMLFTGKDKLRIKLYLEFETKYSTENNRSSIKGGNDDNIEKNNLHIWQTRLAFGSTVTTTSCLVAAGIMELSSAVTLPIFTTLALSAPNPIILFAAAVVVCFIAAALSAKFLINYVNKDTENTGKSFAKQLIENLFVRNETGQALS